MDCGKPGTGLFEEPRAERAVSLESLLRPGPKSIFDAAPKMARSLTLCRATNPDWKGDGKSSGWPGASVFRLFKILFTNFVQSLRTRFFGT